MATNLSLDPKLIDRALEVSGERTKKAAVTRALEELIARRTQKHVAELMRKLERDPLTSSWPRRPLRRLLGAIVVTITATMCASNAARAQQQINAGPSPYGGPPFPEFFVPPGALGGLFAQARPNGIFYDAGRLQFGTPLFWFTRAHEYAHIRRGHVAFNPQHYFMNELQADCDAASLFGWNSSEIQAAAMAYQQNLPPNDTPGMPGSVRRIQNLQQCG